MYLRHLKKLARTRLVDVLLDENVVSREELQDAQDESERTDRSVALCLLDREIIDDWDLARIVATHYGLPFVDAATYSISSAAEEAVDLQFCVENLVLPIDTFGDSIAIAICEMPSSVDLEAWVDMIGESIFFYVTTRKSIVDALGERGADTEAFAAPTPAAVRRAAADAEEEPESTEVEAPAFMDDDERQAWESLFDDGSSAVSLEE